MKLRSLGINIFVLIGLFFLAVSFVFAETSEEYYNRGLVDSKQGNLSQAISNYTKAIELDPNFMMAYGNRGNAYSRQGNFTQAISDFTKSIEINPKLADVYFLRGIAYGEQGDLSQAIVDFSKVVELDPSDGEAFNNRGVAYYRTKDYGKAWQDVQKAQLLGFEVSPNFLQLVKKEVGSIQKKEDQIAQKDVIIFEIKLGCDKDAANCQKATLEESKEEIFVEKSPVITLEDIARSKAISITVAGDTQEGLNIIFNSKGKERFAKITSQNVGKKIALFIDGNLLSAATIREPILIGEILIPIDLSNDKVKSIRDRINQAKGI